MQNQAEREGAAATGAREGAAAPETGTVEGKLSAIAELLGGVATVHITSLEAAATVADERVPAADTSLDTGRLSARVRDAVQNLPDRERQLMDLYYFADKNLEEAGATMGLSKSWACRLHARAVELLRQQLADALD